MLRAFVKNQTDADGGQEGASTLTQQYIKNVLIDDALSKETEAERLAALAGGPRGRAAPRATRASCARPSSPSRSRSAMSKDEILEKYLNIAPFGASVYGAESAAQYYFSKPAKDLNYLEAATIAGVTQSPTKWDPVLNPEASQTRRDTRAGLDERAGLHHRRGVHRRRRDPAAGHHARHAAEAGLRGGRRRRSPAPATSATTSPRSSPTTPPSARPATSAIGLLYRGGLTITTTLDPRLQAIADAEVKNGIPVDDPSGVASAIVTVQPGTGKILSMAQNRDLRRCGHARDARGVRQLQHRRRVRRLGRLRPRLDVQAVHPARVAQAGPQPQRPGQRHRAHAEREPVRHVRPEGARTCRGPSGTPRAAPA